MSPIRARSSGWHRCWRTTSASSWAIARGQRSASTANGWRMTICSTRTTLIRIAGKRLISCGAKRRSRALWRSRTRSRMSPPCCSGAMTWPRSRRPFPVLATVVTGVLTRCSRNGGLIGYSPEARNQTRRHANNLTLAGERSTLALRGAQVIRLGLCRRPGMSEKTIRASFKQHRREVRLQRERHSRPDGDSAAATLSEDYKS